jgi:hypothetical protein
MLQWYLKTPNSEMAMECWLGSAATCPLRWTAHKSSRDFAYQSFGVQRTFSRPTPDSRFCDVIRINGSRSFLSNGPDDVGTSQVRKFSGAQGIAIAGHFALDLFTG